MMQSIKIDQSKIKAALVLLLLAAVYYLFFYPPRVEHIHLEDEIAELGQVVATADQNQIHTKIMSYLGPDVRIRLNVNYVATDGEQSNEGKPAIIYEFTKRQFHAYLGNMLSSLSHHTFEGQVVDFQMGSGWDTAHAAIASIGSAQGTSMFVAKRYDVRFFYEALCDTDMMLTEDGPLISEMNCNMMIPQPVRR